MCVEKTPWEQAIDFHGHTCPEIALGFRAAQIAQREMGLKPTADSELIIKANTQSCALDAFQVLNKCTIGRGNLIVNELGKHQYFFHFSGTNQILAIKILPEVIIKMSATTHASSPRQKQNLILEAIQYILSSKEEIVFNIEKYPGTIEKKAKSSNWLNCTKCGDSILEEYSLKIDEAVCCPECVG